MPRPSNELAALVSDLQSRLAHVVDVARAEGNASALEQIRSLVGGGSIDGGGTPVRRGPGRPLGSRNKPKAGASAKPKQKRKNSWSGLSAAARLARVNAIRKGKGLAPRSE
jgi:hypothetical protein